MLCANKTDAKAFQLFESHVVTMGIIALFKHIKEKESNLWLKDSGTIHLRW